MEAKVGQLAELVWKNDNQNTEWCYCVVERIFDDRVQFLREDGLRYMHILNTTEQEEKLIGNQPTDSLLTMLYNKGKPAMAKRRLFGGFTF